MSCKEVLFNIIIPLITGVLGATISANIYVSKVTNKIIMKNKDVRAGGDIVNGNKS